MDNNKRECIINGVKTPYRFWATGSLEVAKKKYSRREYLGSGQVYYINGEIRTSDNVVHCLCSKAPKI